MNQYSDFGDGREGRIVGVTVLGDFIVSEGVEPILDNLQRAGVTAVACNPTVTVPAAEGEGSFQPPTDAGSSPRVFDRLLFNKQALWLQSGPSYYPDETCYRDSVYRPRKPNAITDKYGECIEHFIKSAQKRGLKVYFQIGAVQPSGLRDEDRPRLPDGRVPENRMADTASLASVAVRDYTRCYIQDLFRQYPDLDGFRIDWPEYPCYTFDEIFQDFSCHASRWIENHPESGFHFENMKRVIGECYDYLNSRLTNEDIQDLASPDRGKGTLLHFLTAIPELGEWLRFKRELSSDVMREYYHCVKEFGGQEKELHANAFMPPYSVLTGFAFPGFQKESYCDSVSPKFYTMHWSQMVEFWGRRLLENNAAVDEEILVKALVQLMDLDDDPAITELSGYGYPKPDEPHPVPDAPQIRKLQQAMSAAGTRTPLVPLIHGYGPDDDFQRRLQLVANSSVPGVWINRYGYLNDSKLSLIASM